MSGPSVVLRTLEEGLMGRKLANPRPRKSVRGEKAWREQRIAMGLHAIEVGAPLAARTFVKSRQLVYYWKKKLLNKNFHSNSHGGTPNLKWNGDVRTNLLAHIWLFIQQRPDSSLREIQNEVAERFPDHPTPSLAWLSRLFKRWCWSFKVPDRRAQLNKFTIENIHRYVHFVAAIHSIDPLRMKFIDEANYSSADLYRQHALGPVNRRQHVVVDKLSESYSLIMMTSLDPATPPVMIDMKVGTNDQTDFLRFVASMLSAGYLREGDMLFVDNAKIHGGDDTFAALWNLLQVAGVSLHYLPTYSPELNPCEFCWGFSKNMIRKHCQVSLPFSLEILKSLACISRQKLVGWYKHCRTPQPLRQN